MLLFSSEGIFVGFLKRFIIARDWEASCRKPAHIVLWLSLYKSEYEMGPIRC
jgi:hypothetical protein